MSQVCVPSVGGVGNLIACELKSGDRFLSKALYSEVLIFETDFISSPARPDLTWCPQMQLKLIELTLEQKIFIVQSFYGNNMNTAQVRIEFEERFQIETAKSIEDTFREIVEIFEEAGSTAEHHFYYELVETRN